MRSRSPRPTRLARARLAPACIALVALLTAPITTTAAVVEGGPFDERVRTGDVELDLYGAALLRYRVVFRAYVAALYVAEPDHARNVLDDVPKRLELSYFWPIAGEDFGPAAETILARTLSDAELASLRERLDRLHRAYRDVEPGDRYTLTYVPGRGTELALNGRTIATVEGADFARAYFGIWLGEKPLDAGLRDALLGGQT